MDMIQVQSTLGSFWRQVCVHRATAISLIDIIIDITSNFTKFVVYMIMCVSVKQNLSSIQSFYLLSLQKLRKKRNLSRNTEKYRSKYA